MTDDALDMQTTSANFVKSTSNALPVLIARAGGSVTITKAEFDQVMALYGGPSKVAIRMERIDTPGEPAGSTIRLTMIRKEPSQGELPV